MKDRCLSFIIIPLFLVSPACVKNTGSGASTSSQEQACNAHSDYAWVEGSCIAKSSSMYQQQLCSAKGAAYTWLNNQCIAAAAADTNPLPTEATCTAAKDGSVWEVNPATGVGTCLSPTQQLTAQTACTKQGFTWDAVNVQCLDSTAQACLKNGNSWRYGECLTPALLLAYTQCQSRSDGAVWINLECVGLSQSKCAQQGYYKKWVPAASGTQGSCLPKLFLDYCQDRAAPADIAKTVTAILNNPSIHSSDCNTASTTLAGLGSLDLSGSQLTNAYPLTGLSLQTLNLASNLFAPLDPLGSLLQLSDLNLDNNQLTNITAISSFSNLKTLSLNNNKITDLSPLSGLVFLQSLSLQNNNLTGDIVAGLANVAGNLAGGLSQLKTLVLDNNCTLTNVNAIAQFYQLTQLSLKQTGIPRVSVPVFPGGTVVDFAACP